jgi:hypothetical protein
MFTKASSILILLVSVLILSVAVVDPQDSLAVGGIHPDHPLAVNGTEPLTGPPFPVSERSSSESQPAIAYNPIDKEFLVVWSNYWGPSAWDIYAQRISFDGRLLSWFYVGDGWFPDVAYNPANNSFLVVYQREDPVNGDDIWARRVTFAGPLDPEFPVANTSAQEWHPSVAFNEHGNFQDFMVVWEKSDQIQAQRVAGLPQGGPGGSELIGPKLDVSQSGKLAWWPDIAYNLNRNEYLVVYQQESAPASFVFDVYGRRITADSILLPEQAIDSSGNDQYLPKVAAFSPNNATPYLVVFGDKWNDSQGDVRGYLVDGDGLPHSLVNISTATNIYEGDADVVSSVAMGGYTVIWVSTDGATHLWARRVDPDGSLEATFRVSETPLSPGYYSESAVASGSPLSLVAWETSGLPLRDLAGRLLGYIVNLPLVSRK